MIDINELRPDVEAAGLNAISVQEVLELLDRLEEAESECLEQARLNGMGASREAALLAKLEAAEKERDWNAERLEDAIEECAALRAKIEAMEKQKPAMWANSSNIISARISTERGSAGDQHTCSETKTAYHDTPIYLAPGAQPAPFDDSATIAGLESTVTHLSVLLDSFRALLVEVNDVCGRDGHGGQLEDGESEIIDKVRAAISMTEAPPCAKGEEK